MNDIQINFAQAEDLPEILEVRYDALYQSAWAFYSPREVKVLLQDSGLHELRLMVTDSLLFKAVNVDGAIVGSSGHYKGHLRHLYVHPDYQGLGIGKKLLHYTEKHFVKNAHIPLFYYGWVLLFVPANFI